MTPEEFSASHGFNPETPWPETAVSRYEAPSGLSAPASVDWVSQGAVTAVKNQGQCGSCWSFSTTGSLEGAYQIATGKLVSLSEQQLVDCDSSNSGCQGGVMATALQFEEQHDICTEDSYRYRASAGSCQASGCSVGIPRGGVTGIQMVGSSEQALLAAVVGRPIAIAVDAGPFQSYYGGVLTDCSHSQLDHGVLLVGYGTDFLKVKNSWGASWGESGYIRMKRGVNCCNLANSYAVFPIVSGSSITV